MDPDPKTLFGSLWVPVFLFLGSRPWSLVEWVLLGMLAAAGGLLGSVPDEGS